MNCFWFFVCLGFFLRYRWKEIDIAVLGSSVIRTSCLIGKSQTKERQPASFWMTSAYPSRLHLDLGGSRPPTALTPKTRLQTRLPRREPAAPHPCLTSFSQANRPANPELVGTHSSNNSPASPNSPACEVSSAARGVRFQRFPAPFPSLWTPGVRLQQRRPVPSPCQSGLQVAGLVAPPLSPRRPGIWKVCVRRRRVSQS